MSNFEHPSSAISSLIVVATSADPKATGTSAHFSHPIRQLTVDDPQQYQIALVSIDFDHPGGTPVYVSATSRPSPGTAPARPTYCTGSATTLRHAERPANGQYRALLPLRQLHHGRLHRDRSNRQHRRLHRHGLAHDGHAQHSPRVRFAPRNHFGRRYTPLIEPRLTTANMSKLTHANRVSNASKLAFFQAISHPPDRPAAACRSLCCRSAAA